ncbi:MAG: hypothetical protein EXS10_08095 [Phycisphaerales bacterium]|nr:hypothetical protein [Phycisphaerales bacterium]
MSTRASFALVSLALVCTGSLLAASSTPSQSPPSSPAANTGLPDGRGVVERSLSVIGSKEARDSIKSTAMKLTIKSLMGTSKVSLTLLEPNRVLMTQSVEGSAASSVEIGFDGTTGWMSTPNAAPRVLTPEMCAQFSKGADAQELARSLDTRFVTFTTIGAETIDGIDTWKVKMVDSDDIASTGAFAKATGLLRALENTQKTPQGEMTSRTVFDRWEQVGPVQCFRVLTVTQSGAKQDITFDEIAFNAVKDDAIRAPASLRATPPTPQR